ncbi:MAG: ArnT family glycosyltransferase [Mastigocoleus sp.]
MQQRNQIWHSLEKLYLVIEKRIDWVWITVLFLAATFIFTINLGELPLRDWDEGTVAQVAREIFRAPFGSHTWLYPTLGGEPYYNKPPLMHILISWIYRFAGINEWTSRVPGAFLTALSVPLLYAIAREIYARRSEALYSALIYLTMLPVVRHGRLAMLDGAVLCFFMVMVVCLLRSRRDLRYCLGVGIGFGLICLTKGMLAILLGTVAFAFLLWDTPRLLTSKWMWFAMFLGSLPILLWYYLQITRYGNSFIDEGLLRQSFNRISESVENHRQPLWYYPLEIIKYTSPWLIFIPSGLRYTWENRNSSWARFVLSWFSVYLIAISLMSTKLPWYIFPIYPSIALACGARLAQVENLPLLTSYPRHWTIGLAFLAVGGVGGALFYIFGNEVQISLAFILAAFALSAILTINLLRIGDRKFFWVLLWGTYVSLVLLMKSNYWNWELNEAYPVKPVAAMIQTFVPNSQIIYTSSKNHRPSLDFYSDRKIIPKSLQQIQSLWEKEIRPYFLLEEPDFKQLNLKSLEVLGSSSSSNLKLILVTKNTNN